MPFNSLRLSLFAFGFAFMTTLAPSALAAPEPFEVSGRVTCPGGDQGLEVEFWLKACNSNGGCRFLGGISTDADGHYVAEFWDEPGAGPYSLFIVSPNGVVTPNPSDPGEAGSAADAVNICCPDSLDAAGALPEHTIVFDVEPGPSFIEGLDFEVDDASCVPPPDPVIDVSGRVTCLGTDIGLEVELWVKACSSTGSCRFLGGTTSKPDGTWSKTFADVTGGSSYLVFVPDPPGPVSPAPTDPAQLGDAQSPAVLCCESVLASHGLLPEETIAITTTGGPLMLEGQDFEIDLGCPPPPPPPPTASCEPLTQGFWNRQCSGADHPSGEPGKILGYLPCLADTATWADLTEACAIDLGGSDKCHQAENQFLALLMNVCSGRLSADCALEMGDSPELSGIAPTTVGEAIAEVDALLSSPERSFEDCVRAQALADGINRADFVIEAAQYISGDIAPTDGPDGRVDVGDVLAGLRLAVGLAHANESALRRANVSPAFMVPHTSPPLAIPLHEGTPRVDVADVLLLLRVSVGLARFD